MLRFAVGASFLLLCASFQSTSAALPEKGLVAAWWFAEWDSDGTRPDTETLGPDMDRSGQANFGARMASTVKIKAGEGLDVTTSTYAYTKLADFGLGNARTITSFFRMKSEGGTGGSAITLHRPNTDYFDGIIWAERQTRKWMAGSSGFRRTQDLTGDCPQEVNYRGQERIMMSIVYSQDGTIQLYRNGKPYGDSYRKGNTDYPNGKLHIGFGPRHIAGSSCSKGCMDMTVAAAFVHNRALTTSEVQDVYAAAQAGSGTTSTVTATTTTTIDYSKLLEDKMTEVEKVLQGEIDKVTQRLEKSEADNAALKTQVSELQSGSKTVSVRFGEAESRLAELDGTGDKLAQMAQDVDDAKTAAVGAKNDVASLRSALTAALRAANPAVAKATDPTSAIPNGAAPEIVADGASLQITVPGDRHLQVNGAMVLTEDEIAAAVVSAIQGALKDIADEVDA